MLGKWRRHRPRFPFPGFLQIRRGCLKLQFGVCSARFSCVSARFCCVPGESVSVGFQCASDYRVDKSSFVCPVTLSRVSVTSIRVSATSSRVSVTFSWVSATFSWVSETFRLFSVTSNNTNPFDILSLGDHMNITATPSTSRRWEIVCEYLRYLRRLAAGRS